MLLKGAVTKLSRSVWEHFDVGRVYRPHCARSALSTTVKISCSVHTSSILGKRYLVNKHFFLLLDEVEQHVAICQWRAVQLFAEAKCQGK